jgi:hypothetical protein
VAARRVRDVRRAGAVRVHDVEVVLIRHPGVSDESESGGVRGRVLVGVENQVVGDPRHIAAVGIHRVDLGALIAIRGKGDSTGHRARRDTVGCGVVRDVRLAGAVCVHDVDLGAGRAPAGAAATVEDDSPVARPGRNGIRRGVGREPGLGRSVRVHLVDLVIAVSVAREGDLGAVSRPAGGDVAARAVRNVGLCAPFRVHRVDLLVAVSGAHERDLPVATRKSRVGSLRDRGDADENGDRTDDGKGRPHAAPPGKALHLGLAGLTRKAGTSTLGRSRNDY